MLKQKTEEKTDDEKFRERLEKSYEGVMEDLSVFNELDRLEEDGDYECIVELLRYRYGEKHEYGLSLDFVEMGTFTDQKREYIRFQISFGGPSEEIRIYDNGEMEYWFLDWFKGKCKAICPEDRDTIQEFLEYADLEELKERAQR